MSSKANAGDSISLTRRFWLIFGGNQAKGLGRTLQAIDVDKVGQDDLIGRAVAGLGSGLEAMGQGNKTGADNFLKATADGIYEYLGLEPVQFPEEDPQPEEIATDEAKPLGE